jgi:predicted amidohydrolase YtcJ
MKLIHNARIHTLVPARPVASALVIDGETVVAVGGEELAAGYASAQAEDMGGQVILPGLTDAHIHLQEYALRFKIVDCGIPSRQEILGRVAERARETPQGEWIRGHGWDQNTWGGGWPTSSELDAVAPNHPVYLTARSLHAAWVNDAALQQAGITTSTSFPESRFVQRCPDGKPTGILFEQALKLVEAVIPEPSPESLADTFQTLFRDLSRIGLTGVHDFDKRTCYEATRLLHARGERSLRVVKSIPLDQLSQTIETGLRTGSGDDFLRTGSLKLFADGALGPHTGAMFEPYVDEPQNRGILLMDAEMLFEHGRQAVENGISLAVHAIGDRAVHEALDGFSRLRDHERAHGLPALRHRIEHVQTIRQEDAGRMAGLGIIASMQPVHATSDMLIADRALGKRAALSYAWQKQLESGARLAFGSDAPVESPNPFLGLHAAVTRRRTDGSPGPEGWFPQQRLNISSALDGFTSGPAYAAGMENRLGRLAEGFLADLIVLETDPFACDPSALHAIQPVATMVGGGWVWQS